MTAQALKLNTMLIMTALSMWPIAGSVRAAVTTSDWNSGADGHFNIATNWSNSHVPTWYPSDVPPDGDSAAFGVIGNYKVTFDSGVKNAALSVTNGNVTFDLGGNTYEVAGNATIGSAVSPQLILTNGTLKNSGAFGYIGGTSVGKIATVTVSTGGTWDLTGHGIEVGYSTGQGNLVVEKGGTVKDQAGYLSMTNATGNVTVDGENSLWTSSSGLYIGYYTNSHSTLLISNGGKVSTYEASVSQSDGNDTQITITGADPDGNPSTWTSAAVNLYAAATVNINDGGLFESTNTLTANKSSIVNLQGSGTLKITNALVFNFSTLNVSGLSNSLSASATTFDNDAVFTIKLASGDANSADASLNIAGPLTLGAHGIDVLLDTGYSPAAGDSFKLLSWTGTLGQTLDLSTVHLPTLSGGLKWDSSELNAGIVTISVPEPADLTFLGLCGAAMFLRRRRTE